MMNSRFFAASALSTAVGLVLAMQASPVQSQGMQNPPQIVKDNMARMAQQHLEKCYGINAVAKNDCASLSRPVSSFGLMTSCRHRFALRLLTPHGARASLRGWRQATS